MKCLAEMMDGSNWGRCDKPLGHLGPHNMLGECSIETVDETGARKWTKGTYTVVWSEAAPLCNERWRTR